MEARGLSILVRSIWTDEDGDRRCGGRRVKPQRWQKEKPWLLGTCTLDRERMDTKDKVPQPAAVKDEKIEKSVKGQTESPKDPLQRSRGERSIQRSVGKWKDIFLTFRADLKTTRGSVLKNRPPILARSKIPCKNGEWTRLRRNKLKKGAKKDKGRESISVFCGTDVLCKAVHTGTTCMNSKYKIRILVSLGQLPQKRSSVGKHTFLNQNYVLNNKILFTMLGSSFSTLKLAVNCNINALWLKTRLGVVWGFRVLLNVYLLFRSTCNGYKLLLTVPCRSLSKITWFFWSRDHWKRGVRLFSIETHFTAESRKKQHYQSSNSFW